MLGHRVLAHSQSAVRKGLMTPLSMEISRLQGGRSGSLGLTSDLQNQNKQPSVGIEGVPFAGFKTTKHPERPLVNVKHTAEEDDAGLPGLSSDFYIEGLNAGEHEFDPDRARDFSQVEYTIHHLNQQPGYETTSNSLSMNQSHPLSLDIERNKMDTEMRTSLSINAQTAPERQVESYDCKGSISLHCVMQSMVPEPFQPTSTAPTHVNMPGGGHQMTLKYLNDRELHNHQSRHHSTSLAYKKQLLRKFSTYAYGSSSVQGVQGDMTPQGNAVPRGTPDPQGIQGDDCARFELWLKNCGKFGNCEEQLEAVRSGRKTLQQIFAEQDEQIRLAGEKLSATGQGVDPSVSHTSILPPKTSDSSSTPKGPSSNDENPNPKSSREKLKKAIRDYGATVVVFHVGISIISLGGFYLLVKSGIDVIGIIKKLGIGQTFLESKLAAGASTFVVAYAVHKVFAPARIGITLTATPFIVRYLRRVGFLKKPQQSVPSK